jgi:hypothetical protein
MQVRDELVRREGEEERNLNRKSWRIFTLLKVSEECEAEKSRRE